MKKTILSLSAAAIAVCSWALWTPNSAHSHCEIPCGIYGDSMRISMLYENITTVEKSMTKITELSASKTPDWNQLVRWVKNKEDHANEIQHIVTQYFMTQRVKAANPKYVDQLKSLHGMLVEAMKCKQTTKADHVKALRDLVGAFSKAYFTPEQLKHIHSHHPEGK